jgi:hypothetical protein
MMTKLSRQAIVALLASTLLAEAVQALDPGRQTEVVRSDARRIDAQTSAAKPMVPVDEAGSFGIKLETEEPLARHLFDQGFGHLWAFDHAEAVRSFRAAQEVDPGCALCFWGEAYALGPTLRNGESPENAARAWRAALIAAGQARSVLDVSLTRALLARYAPAQAIPDSDREFADRMRAIARIFSDDANVLAIAADAMMIAQGDTYWEADGETPKGFGAEILAMLGQALAIAPDHPAALHLYIHAVEASADPARAEAAARRLAGLGPETGRLLHLQDQADSRVGTGSVPLR